MKHTIKTEYTHTYTFTEGELEEILMSAWVNGWIETNHKNDDGKREYTRHILSQLRNNTFDTGV